MKNVKIVEVELSGEDWTKILDDTFNKKKNEVKIDGFRKGKITKEIFIKKLGIEALYADAVDAALPIAYQKALKENKLIPVIEPKADIKHICDDCITFEFTIVTKPEIKLGKYKDLGIKRDKISVTEAEIDEEIDKLRDKMAEIVVKENGKIVNGNTAIINFEGYVDGKKLENASGENYPLEIGSNTFIPGFETGLIGMATGEVKELNLKFPDEYVDELKGKDVLFKVTIMEIKERLLPEINTDLFKDLGYEDVTDISELKKRIKEEIEKRKEIEVNDKYTDVVIEAASKNMEVIINDEIIDDELDHMIEQYREQLSYQGLSLEQYYQFTKTTESDLKEKMKEEASKRIKARYLLEAIVEAEKIDVTEAEVEKDIEDLSAQYQMTKEEFIKAFGGVDMLKYDMKMRKALDFLKK